MSDFDPAKPVQTRDGRKARIVCKDVKHEGGGVILALITRVNCDEEDSFSYLPDGRWWAKSADRELDLINIPETHEVMVYFFQTGSGHIHAGNTNTSGDAFASKLFKVTEGEFD